MKKTYIHPETQCHQVEVESPLLAASISDDVRIHTDEVDNNAEQY